MRSVLTLWEMRRHNFESHLTFYMFCASNFSQYIFLSSTIKIVGVLKEKDVCRRLCLEDDTVLTPSRDNAETIVPEGTF